MPIPKSMQNELVQTGTFDPLKKSYVNEWISRRKQKSDIFTEPDDTTGIISSCVLQDYAYFERRRGVNCIPPCLQFNYSRRPVGLCRLTVDDRTFPFAVPSVCRLLDARTHNADIICMFNETTDYGAKNERPISQLKYCRDNDLNPVTYNFISSPRLLPWVLFKLKHLTSLSFSNIDVNILHQIPYAWLPNLHSLKLDTPNSRTRRIIAKNKPAPPCFIPSNVPKNIKRLYLKPYFCVDHKTFPFEKLKSLSHLVIKLDATKDNNYTYKLATLINLKSIFLIPDTKNSFHGLEEGLEFTRGVFPSLMHVQMNYDLKNGRFPMKLRYSRFDSVNYQIKVKFNEKDPIETAALPLPIVQHHKPTPSKTSNKKLTTLSALPTLKEICTRFLLYHLKK